MTPETKVPDRTKGGREGKKKKTLLWVNRYPTRMTGEGRCAGKNAAHEHDIHVIV